MPTAIYYIKNSKGWNVKHFYSKHMAEQYIEDVNSIYGGVDCGCYIEIVEFVK